MALRHLGLTHTDVQFLQGCVDTQNKKTTWKKGAVRLCPNSPPWHLPLQLQSGMLTLHYYPLLFISPRCVGWSMLSSVLETYICGRMKEGLNCHLMGQRCVVGHHYISCMNTRSRWVGSKLRGKGGIKLPPQTHNTPHIHLLWMNRE